MALKLTKFEANTKKAIRTFWKSRSAAYKKQVKSGKSDQGARASVTAGKNMDGFISLIHDLVLANGLPEAEVHKSRSVLTLPGYFRATKIWDLLVVQDKKLIAAIELKSQVGPSFGNNFNNRSEEAIGTAQDFWTAYREGALGDHPRPFVGWLMLVEDTKESRRPVKTASPHFPILEEFQGASYLKRYDLLCQKLIKEQLYSSACLLTSPSTASKSGKFSNLSEMTSIKTFVSSFAGHIASEAARLKT